MKLAFSICAAALSIGLASARANIIGGQVAGVGAAPFIVSIRKDGSHNCGGSLIAKDVVLTAGHCLMDVAPRSLTVVAGSNSVKEGGVERNVSKGITNDDFDSLKRIHDIALLKLAEPVQFTKAIQPIKLFQKQEIKAGTNVTVYGWGYTSYPPGPRPTELHVVSRSTISTAACNDAWMAYDKVNITEGQVCTQAGSLGTCMGDSGGPLVLTGADNQTYQVGLVSYGVPCAKNYPDVFTKVPSYLKWIADNSA
ncbi:chymotrypsin-like proteinase 5A precursor [Cordyceps javanica]|uniref:Chymotrypsin-like proteinase 5A n=1 Tax=Cordyceps javanica TaxID=43265 RepID=A0A545VGK1_9HYPO|nr:chymotrypsin-like proteinase 5A precursor [Cordyceps javanica]TQW12032.1 chymotrypsin-like proteinase 5A precursor [Cordyceps javanica]